MTSPEAETQQSGESVAEQEARTEAAQVDIDQPERAEASVDRAERMKRWGEALERPMIGATVAGGLFAAVAGAWGPTEAVLGAVAGLLVYRSLKRRRRERPAESRSEREPERREKADDAMPPSIH